MSNVVMTDPTRYPRRSFVYRRLRDAGAVFADCGDTAVADAFPGRGGLPSRLALIDLSPLPRIGFKGPQTLEWLSRQAVTIPPQNNRAERQTDGALAVRWADTEVTVLGDIDGRDNTISRLEARTPTGGCYPVPRRDSHAWFVLCGAKAPDCLQKLCGVDFRLNQFDDLAVAQTSLARLSAQIIRQDHGGIPAFHLLADSASALYLWDVLTDAMDEYLGGLAGRAGLRALREQQP